MNGPLVNALQGQQRSFGAGGGTQEIYITPQQYNEWINMMMGKYPAFTEDNPWAQLFSQYAMSGEPMLATIKEAMSAPSTARTETLRPTWQEPYEKLPGVGQPPVKAPTPRPLPFGAQGGYGRQRSPLEEALRRLQGGV